MNTINWKFGYLIAGMLALGLVASACGDANEENNSAPITTEDAGTDVTDDGTTQDPDSGQTEPDPDKAELPNPDDYMYSASHTFTMDDLLGGTDGVTASDDPSIICQSGCEDSVQTDGSVTLYPVDNGFGWDTVDFVGATLRERDGNHAEGWIGALNDSEGNQQGIAVANVSTSRFKVGPKMGQWCGGLGGNLVKCKTDHYSSMEHVLTCHETVPYLTHDPVTGEPVSSDYANCPPLDDTLDMDPLNLTEYMFDLDESNMAQGPDYTLYLGEHEGEYKYLWGNWEKRPTDIRLLATIPLPDEWKEEGKTFRITEGKLAIVHTITNNPNDKIKLEDVDTEEAAGRLPDYEIESDGRWVSTKDCYEGDGDFIPAGTTLRNPPYADESRLTEGLKDGFTNAYFTTLDRAPFENVGEYGARWRLKAGKFGQDLPGVEIPVEPCTPAPLKKDQIKYSRGDLTTTIIDITAPLEPGEESPLALSTGYVAPNGEQTMVSENLTDEGVKLTEDLDLSLFIKGDKKPVRLYKAVLYLDYEEVTDEQ